MLLLMLNKIVVFNYKFMLSIHIRVNKHNVTQTYLVKCGIFGNMKRFHDII